MPSILLLGTLVLILRSTIAGSSNGPFSMTLGIGQNQQIEINEGELHPIKVTVDASSANYSAFVLQAHAERYELTLTNTSADCTYKRECSTNGSHIGMVQIINYRIIPIPDFTLTYYCPPEWNCSSTQRVLVAVVGIPLYHPIPGGCSLTSALEMDASLTVVSKGSKAVNVTFQDSDIGFDPHFIAQPPCADKFKFVTRLKYEIQQMCLSKTDTDSVFSALQHMLTPHNLYQSYMHHFPVSTLSYSEAKRIVYHLQSNAVIFNVIATDTKGFNISTYIPTVAYGCDPVSGECDTTIPISTWVCGILVGLTGLYLCLLGHRFFHVEVVVYTMLITSYLMYMMLLAVTDWEGAGLAAGTIGLGVMLTLLFFLLWFFSNWYHVFLLLFGMSMGFVLTAALLYTPVGSYSVVKVSYVYWLMIACGSFIFMVPIVLVSSAAINILSSAVVGSYSVMFCVSLFVDSSFSEIILRVARNAAIHDNLSFNTFCGLSSIDITFWCMWGLMCLMSLVFQTLIEAIRRARFKKLQRDQRTYNVYLFGGNNKKYSAFPTMSLFARCKQSCGKGKVHTVKYIEEDHNRAISNNESRPLLSPSRLTGGGSHGGGKRSSYLSVSPE